MKRKYKAKKISQGGCSLAIFLKRHILKKLNADKFFFWISVCHFMTHFPCFYIYIIKKLTQSKSFRLKNAGLFQSRKAKSVAYWAVKTKSCTFKSCLRASYLQARKHNPQSRTCPHDPLTFWHLEVMNPKHAQAGNAGLLPTTSWCVCSVN